MGIAQNTFDWIRSWNGTYLYMIETTKVIKLVSERFGSEAKFRESRLALFDLVCLQFDLSDIWRLVGELSVKAACVPISLQMKKEENTSCYLQVKICNSEVKFIPSATGKVD